ncbi:branched-chain amino acid ABC transporter substrate-binding protein [Methylobacterium trifolii]|uniref:Leu/Ile/Val-binding protein n=1 Tax=Methylobacterium trifolii TaxID=1003092 RepID=A0ABQ4TTL9_9HYPH|nr:branched-chain amino acid ABC transporter substrate-binding protein [Methylobacterium trifolii]GJE58097.1 Leu/Ile/Val-binding protein [Methylobacterium trifolii]
MRVVRVFGTLGLTLLLAVSPAAAQGQPPVRIGLSAPLTGSDAAFGQGMRIGAEQAVADLNRAAGPGGRRFALVVADDAGEIRQGVAVARRFAGDGIRLVVGPLESSVVAAVAPVYDEAGAVLVAPGAAYAPLTGRGLAGLFRLAPSDAQQGLAAGAYLAGLHGGRPIAIVHDRTTFGRGLAEAVSGALKAAGNPEVLFEGVARGARDAPELIASLKAAGPAAVYFGGLAPEAAMLVRALREAGLSATFVSGDGILDRDFATAAGAAGEGTVMTLPAEPRRLPDPRSPGRPVPRSPEADAVAAGAYAAVELLAQAVERARSADGRKVADALHGDVPFRTVMGEVAFDAKGDTRRGDLVLRVWRRTPDGRLDYAGNEPAP